MGHHKRFLAALTTLFCIFQSGVSEASSCSDLRSLENGQTFFRYNGLFVIFSCRHGYRLLGHKTSSCVSGRWSREPPVCVGSGCPSPGPVAHGSFSVNRDASWVVFSCDTGHKLIGPSTLYCKGSEWNSSQPVCEDAIRETAPKPLETLQSTTFNTPKVQNAATSLIPMTTKTTEHVFQSQKPVSNLTKSFRIKTNFASTSPSPTENIKSSTIIAKLWTTARPFSDLKTSQNAAASSSKSEAINAGQTANDVQAFQPVLLSPTKSILTTPLTRVVSTAKSENNTFSSAQEEEKSDIGRTSSCPEPPVPAHGAFYFGNKEREKGDHIVYVCAHGFTLDEGDAFRHCQEGATWSGVTPVCKDVDECTEGKHHCQHRCINTPGSYLCSCHHGYQPSPDGTSCTDLDECAFPAAVTGCLFGCVNSPGSFHCLCPSGFTTQSPDGHCQDIDECVEHGGLGPCSERCHNSPGSFHCSCSYGFTLAGDGRTCISECPKGYRKAPIKPHHSTAPPTGRCEDINECDDVGWCEGRCINLPGTFRCVCPRGFTLTEDKRRCKDINECSQNNGGCSHVCINRRRTFKCVCPPSYRPSSSSWSKCVPRLTL